MNTMNFKFSHKIRPGQVSVEERNQNFYCNCRKATNDE